MTVGVEMLLGVRGFANSRCDDSTAIEEKHRMLTMRNSMDLVRDPRNLDESVREVFETMLGVACGNVPEDTAHIEDESGTVTAVVGFGGILSGACVFRCDSSGAMRIAERMTGMEFTSVDDTVKDGIGEICNMLAGTWKSKVPDLAAQCGLSTPAVITGSNYELHVQAPEFRIRRIYTLEDVSFLMCIVCDGVR
jgi:chemotaxis protein CheX